MLGKRKDGQRGDTIIEVLFAITVFSFVAISSLSIMNQGSATAERALEITQVRSEITSQTQTLQFLNDAFIGAYQQGEPLSSYITPTPTPAGEWAKLMISGIDTSGKADAFPPSGGVCPTSAPTSSFILNTQQAEFLSLSNNAGTFVPATTYSQLNYTNNGTTLGNGSVQGIWIQAIESPPSIKQGQTNQGYIDFHIDACWDSPGQSVPATIGTIVRLYVPR